MYNVFLWEKLKVSRTLATWCTYQGNMYRIYFLGHSSKMPSNQFGKNEETDTEEDSPLESFVQKSANMPIIWEAVMHNLSETDVARCMKVCRALRSVLRQCLTSNSKMRKELDVAATVRALKVGYVQSTLQVSFELEKTWGPVGPYYTNHPNFDDSFFVLDNIWFRKEGRTKWIDIFKLGPHGEGVYFEEPLKTNSWLHDCNIKVCPTTNAKRVFIFQQGMRNLINVESESAAIVSTYRWGGFESKWGRLGHVEQGETDYETFQVMRPFFANHILCRGRNPENGKRTIFLQLLDSEGEPGTVAKLCELTHDEEKYEYYHATCNEQVRS